MKRKIFALIAICWLLVACGASTGPPTSTIVETDGLGGLSHSSAAESSDEA